MKNILKVTILFCLIVGAFVIPSFAAYDNQIAVLPVIESGSNANNGGVVIWHHNQANKDCYAAAYVNDIYLFCIQGSWYFVSESNNSQVACWYYNYNTVMDTSTYDSSTGLYYNATGGYASAATFNYLFSDFSSGMNAVKDYIDNKPEPGPTYTKNPNVDEFIANTLISMGVKFDTPAYAISYASDAWDWCIDETNMETANPFDEWNIESFVSYCNAQSNNYLNWYNGYKVSKDVTNALGEYIRQNIRSLTGLPVGVTSLTGAYLPIYHYGSGFQSGVSSPTAQTFYAAQTITYFNGEYVNETDDISTSQFLYTPADVRRFLGYSGSSPVITPSSPTGTGTITDDPNNPGQKNISINFPSLDWLADAIKSILDFLRDAFTTLANLLTQLLDAILGLFSDAFESLQDFGQGIIDFIQSVFFGLSDLLSGYVPSDISVIIVTFIALNFGIGLITFVLKGH